MVHNIKKINRYKDELSNIEKQLKEEQGKGYRKYLDGKRQMILDILKEYGEDVSCAS